MGILPLKQHKLKTSWLLCICVCACWASVCMLGHEKQNVLGNQNSKL